MKTPIRYLSMLLAFLAGVQFAAAQGTAFTYQGQLQNNGSLAGGTYNLTFTLFTNNVGGTAVAGPVTNNAVVITNGLFMVLVDFGAGPWNGETNWLEIGVGTNGTSPFTTLAPRQQLTPTPYAIYAEGVPAAGISGTLTNGQLAHSAVTVDVGSGLSGGGKVGLGNTIILTNTGVLSVTGNADITAATVGGAVTLGDTGTSADTPSTLVKRDGSGNFSAATITLDGNLNLPSTSISPDIIYSGSSLLLYGDNNGNFFSGQSAGNFGTSGYFNTAIGDSALFFNSGSYNTANGYEALASNTSGSDNTANGYQALYNNTNGSDNTANGFQALFSNTSGSGNTANGSYALNYLLSGNYNTAAGEDALGNSVGSGNTAVGENAFGGDSDVGNTMDNNTAIGSDSLDNLVAGNYNIALGNGAGQNVTNGNNNIEIGSSGVASDNNVIRIGTQGTQTATYIAGVINGNGTGLTNLNVNTAQLSGTVANSQLANSSITVNAGTGLSGGGTVALGSSTTLNNAGVTSLTGGGGVTVSASSGSVTLGSTATSADTANAIVSRDGSGNFSTATLTLDGNLNLPSTTISPDIIHSGTNLLLYGDNNGNFFSGRNAGNSKTSGDENTAIGEATLYYNTSGSDNTAIGIYALESNTSGSDNTANGVEALYASTSGSDNTANGYDALYNLSSGNNNTAVGAAALGNLVGGGNTAVGYNAFGGNSDVGNTLNNNTAIGINALDNLVSGGANIALGNGAGKNVINGSDNIEIGNVGDASDNGDIRIGTNGTQTATFIAGIYTATVSSGVAVYANSSGKLGALSSSRRFKDDIRVMDHASDVLYALKPVTFKYKPDIDPQGIPQFGLVAEDVEKVAPDLVALDDQGKIYTVRYQAVDAMLLNEFLKEHKTVVAQNAEIETLKAKAAKVDSLEKRLNELEKAVARMADKSGPSFALNSTTAANK